MPTTGQSLVTIADGLPNNSFSNDYTLSNMMAKQNLLPQPSLTWNNTTNKFNYSPANNQTIPGSNNANKGLLDQIMSMLGIENAESFAKGAEGLGSLASIGQGIYNAMMQNKAFNLQKSAMEQAMKFNAENQARQRHEWARQDANRASISSSWNGR